MVNLGLFGYLTILAAVLALMFGACAFVFVKRLEDRTPAPLGEEVGVRKAVLDKLRKREPMSQGEVDYAAQVISDCRSLLAYSIPAAAFTDRLLLCVWLSRTVTWSQAHRASTYRVDPHVGVHKPHHSATQGRTVERAFAESFFDTAQGIRCGHPQSYRVILEPAATSVRPDPRRPRAILASHAFEQPRVSRPVVGLRHRVAPVRAGGGAGRVVVSG